VRCGCFVLGMPDRRWQVEHFVCLLTRFERTLLPQVLQLAAGMPARLEHHDLGRPKHGEMCFPAWTAMHVGSFRVVTIREVRSGADAKLSASGAMSFPLSGDLPFKRMSTAATFVNDREQELLHLARGGDQRAYGELVEPHRGAVHAHCYRMLGSLEDADDALQEALLRAWRGLARFERRSSIRTWLYKIATNSCLQMAARRPTRRLPSGHGPAAAPHTPPGEPLSESVWIEPYPDEELELEDPATAPAARYEQRESLELAFVATLQYLPARQRAVLLLREVLDFSAREVAELLDTTVPSVNSALQRARHTVAERVPEQSQQVTLRSLGDERARQLVTAYVDAFERTDLEGLVDLLTEDAAWAMPPLRTWYQGGEAVVPFLEEHALTARWRHLPVRASGQLAVGCYVWSAEEREYEASVLDVLTLRGDRIAEITAFINPRLFARFGLPDRLAD
jgi:RNA polymerase sigma-70 factor (ECF subfamily)